MSPPLCPPGPVSNFKVEINGDGSLTLKWKSDNPTGAAGTMYQVWRRIGAAGAFAYCGGTGAREFVDATVPPGTTSICYQIQAVRSTAVGPWTQFNVNFSTSGESTSVDEGQPVKIAV